MYHDVGVAECEFELQSDNECCMKFFSFLFHGSHTL